MGIADVRAAANAGLGGKGSCIGATMSYARVERVQRLTLNLVVNSAAVTLTEDVPPGVDLTAKAREITAAYAATLE